MRNAPVVDSSGTVYLATEDRLVALVLEQDKPKLAWEYTIGSYVPGPIVLAQDNSLRVHSADGLLHAVTSEGRQLWSPTRVGKPLGWAAPVTDRHGNTWISAYDGGLIRVDAEGKFTTRRFFRSRQKFDSAAVICNDTLYVGSEDGYVFAIRLDGDRGENAWDTAADQGFTGGFVNSSPAVGNDGTLVIAARDEMLFGFSPDGDTAWKTEVPGQLLGSPVIDRHGNLYVGVAQGNRGVCHGLLVSADRNSHKIRWQYKANGPVESTPAIGDDDLVYFGDNSGTIHAVNDRGEAVWTAQVGSAVRSAGTVVAPGQLVFGLDDGTYIAMKCSSAGLAQRGWPKIGGTLGQSGVVDR